MIEAIGHGVSEAPVTVRRVLDFTQARELLVDSQLQPQFDRLVKDYLDRDPQTFIKAAKRQMGMVRHDGSSKEKIEKRIGKREECLLAFEIALQAFGEALAGASGVNLDPSSWESNGFSKMGLPPSLVRQMAAHGYSEPYLVQQKTIPIVLAGKNVAVKSPTGSGKTLVFTAAALTKILNSPEAKSGPQAVVLAVSRELVEQTKTVFDEITPANSGIQTALVHGGGAEGPQIDAMRTAQIVVATPGRLNAILQKETALLRKVSLAALDEADPLVDPKNFLPMTRVILGSIAQGAQIGLFSATLTRGLHQSIGADKPAYVEIAAESPNVTVHFCRVEESDKFSTLIRLLAESKKTLVFCGTRRRATQLSEDLVQAGVPSELLKGKMDQEKRNRAMAQFRYAQSRVMVATDVASRGIDVKGVELVISYDFPETHADHIHRIGRTGRADREGVAVVFVTQEDGDKVTKFVKESKQLLKYGPIPNLKIA